MTYTVLARRYRSQSFDEVVGQEVIARTLQNAIDTGRVAHAYLFVGTRGVGKTSMARIFAKALNTGSEEVGAAIMAGRDTDVIEIDAASNGGVEEARDLIANSEVRPLRGQHKIYIIDEVHMLTREAFNALLKTMEEPPGHVKFVLCTTEAQKVPPTIQSRCQRFDFRNIPARAIAEHLTRVAEQEGVQAEPDLIAMVARMANGSMRDGLSLLDRLLASGESPLTVDLIERLLGLPASDALQEMLIACSEEDVSSALEHVDGLLARGVSIDQLFESLLLTLRDLLIAASCGPETELLEIAGERRKSLVQLADRYDAPALVHLIALIESGQRWAKTSAAPRAVLESVVVQMALAGQLADVTALLEGGARGSPPKKA